MSKKSIARTNIILLILVIVITAGCLYIAKGSDFGGTDAKAEDLINEINPGYTPWFSTLYKSASSEVESLFFALQASLGAGFIGYFIGYSRGKSKKVEE